MEKFIDSRGRERDVEEARLYYGVSPIIQRFGVWCVTEYGLECLETEYDISKESLSELSPDYGWIDHMSEKVWVNIADFTAAYYAALRHHFPKPEAA